MRRDELNSYNETRRASMHPFAKKLLAEKRGDLGDPVLPQHRPQKQKLNQVTSIGLARKHPNMAVPIQK